MTEEEFQRLPPEQQQAVMQQLQQAQEMRVDYGAMADPYGQSPNRDTGPAPTAQGAQEQAMPSAGGGGGMQGLPPGLGDKIGQGLKTKFGGGALGAEGGASIAGLASGEAPVAAGSLYGGYGSAPITVGAAEGLGAGGAAGGGGGGGMLAAAGPWAALAAAIFLNEKQAKDKGRRDEDSSSRLVDQLSGAVLEQDADALGDKMGGPLGQATKVVGRLGNPEGLFKTLKKGLKPWEWF